MNPRSEIYNVDCLEYMRSLPDNAFDLAVVDPPYGINAGKMTMGIGTRRTYSRGKDWDAGVPGPEYFEQLFRVAREQIIWGGNYFQLPLSEDWIVWDKMNYGRSFSEAEFAWCSIHRKIRVFRFRTTTPVEGGKIHPTQKPVELYTWILSNDARGGVTDIRFSPRFRGLKNRRVSTRNGFRRLRIGPGLFPRLGRVVQPRLSRNRRRRGRESNATIKPL